MSHKLLIKTGLGRVLLDSDATSLPFQILPLSDKWAVQVEGVAPDVVHEIKRVLPEVHLFYFERTKSLEIIQKWWMYDIHLPQLVYDETDQKLQIIVDSKVAYTN